MANLVRLLLRVCKVQFLTIETEIDQHIFTDALNCNVKFIVRISIHCIFNEHFNGLTNMSGRGIETTHAVFNNSPGKLGEVEVGLHQGSSCSLWW